jgi:hypothetical protein
VTTIDRETLWLERICIGFVALGVALPVAWMTPPFALYRDAVASAVGDASILDGDGARLIAGITGGSIAGKWTLHWAIAHFGLRARERWAWNATIAGLGTWFVIDSISSLLGGAWANVVMINGLPPLLVLPLAWRLRARCDREVAPLASERPVARLAMASAIVVWISGLVIAFGTESPAFATWWAGLSAAHYGGASVPPAMHALVRFFAGPIGGSTAGHAIMLALVARHAIGSAAPWAARWSAASVLAWALTDSAWSFASNGAFDVWLVNGPCTLLLLAPLAWAATRTTKAR